MSNQTELERLKAEMDAARKASWEAACAAYAAYLAWDLERNAERAAAQAARGDAE